MRRIEKEEALRRRDDEIMTAKINRQKILTNSILTREKNCINEAEEYPE